LTTLPLEHLTAPSCCLTNSAVAADQDQTNGENKCEKAEQGSNIRSELAYGCDDGGERCRASPGRRPAYRAKRHGASLFRAARPGVDGWSLDPVTRHPVHWRL